MIRYKTKREPPWVIPVECPVPGYPSLDVDREIQYVNTHFDTEEQAWENLLENTAAAQSLAVESYEEAKKTLSTATTRLAEKASTHSRCQEAFGVWKHSEEKKG